MVTRPQTYKIRTFQDLLNALRAHPEWREELRRLVLTDELLNLPREFHEFREHEFKPLVGRVDRIEQNVEVLKQDVEVLKQDVGVLKQDVGVLKQDVAGLKGDVGRLKGSDLERRVRERAHAYLGRLIRRARVLSPNDLAQALDKALEGGQLTPEERAEALWADVVVQGQLSSGETRIIIAEVSAVVDKEDVQRAMRRAAIIGKAFGLPAIPVVFGATVTQGAQTLLDSGEVFYIHAE